MAAVGAKNTDGRLRLLKENLQMGPTIANPACTTLAASHSNEVESFVGTLRNYKICNVVPIFGLLNHCKWTSNPCCSSLWLLCAFCVFLVTLCVSSAFLSVSAVRSIQFETTTSPQETQRNAEETQRVIWGSSVVILGHEILTTETEELNEPPNAIGST